MNTQPVFNQLISLVRQCVRSGEFLLSTNQFSTVWFEPVIHSGTHPLLHELLCLFWQRLLNGQPDLAVFACLESFEATAHPETAVSRLTRTVVETVNQPRLVFRKLLFDADSFEVELDDCPEQVRLFLLIEPDTPHDLLISACQHLAMTGPPVSGLITPVESEHLRAADFREQFGIDVIPLLIYEADTGMLRSLLDMTEEPYVRYWQYFEA